MANEQNKMIQQCDFCNWLLNTEIANNMVPVFKIKPVLEIYRKTDGRYRYRGESVGRAFEPTYCPVCGKELKNEIN